MIPENFYDANKEKKTVQIHAHSAGSEYFRQVNFQFVHTRVLLTIDFTGNNTR